MIDLNDRFRLVICKGTRFFDILQPFRAIFFIPYSAFLSIG